MSVEVIHWLHENLVRASWVPLSDAQLQTLGSLLDGNEVRMMRA
jgi:hypothetical protein